MANVHPIYNIKTLMIKQELAKDPKRLFRTSYFPGLGWMMRRELWEEIGPRWPKEHWDHWMRLDATSIETREDDDSRDDVCVRVFRERRARDRDRDGNGNAARARVVGWVGIVRRRQIVGDDDERARGRRRGR